MRSNKILIAAFPFLLLACGSDQLPGSSSGTAGTGGTNLAGSSGGAGSAGGAGQAGSLAPSSSLLGVPAQACAPVTLPADGCVDPGFGQPAPSTCTCPCTRRPGPGRSIRCNAGSGRSVSAMIGPEGGTLELPVEAAGISARVRFPARAVAQPTLITLTELADAPPSSFMDESPLYRLDPVDLQLADLAAIDLPFANLDGVIEPTMALYQASPGASCLSRVSDSYINAGFMQAGIRRLGVIFAGYPRSERTLACP